MRVILSCIIIYSGSVFASSPEAWQSFREELFKDCIERVEKMMRPALIKGDDFGTESFGFILFEGTEIYSRQYGKIICIKDKRSGKTEITGFLPEK